MDNMPTSTAPDSSPSYGMSPSHDMSNGDHNLQGTMSMESDVQVYGDSDKNIHMHASEQRTNNQTESSPPVVNDNNTVNDKNVENNQIANGENNNEANSNNVSGVAVISNSQGSKKKRDAEAVHKLVEEAKARFAVSLDLSKRGLRKVPDELLGLPHLEFLYLEGNEISCLPENFFDCLPSLQWLDLRNNSLVALPSTYIGRHTRLRNLLLQGNELRTLPLELGLVTSINGLNLAKNPLEFPPREVIERGTHVILTFLREVLKAKSEGRFPAVPKLEDLRLDSEEHSSEDEWGPSRRRKKSHASSRSQRSSQSHRRSASYRELSHASNDELVGPVMLSAALQHRRSHEEIKQQHIEKLRKAGVLGTMERDNSRKSSSKRLAKLSQYLEPPPADRAERTYQEERRLAKIRHTKDKQEVVLQKRRDQDALKEWRDESKQKQVKKQREKFIKGKLEYDEAAKVAPFGVDNNHMKMETNEERIARDIREKHESMRQKRSPETQQRFEEERRKRDYELEEKIRQHTHQMQERRRRPQGTPQEEMLAAKRELEVAENLQREIEHRRKELEYRFTAFTG